MRKSRKAKVVSKKVVAKKLERISSRLSGELPHINKKYHLEAALYALELAHKIHESKNPLKHFLYHLLLGYHHARHSGKLSAQARESLELMRMSRYYTLLLDEGLIEKKGRGFIVKPEVKAFFNKSA